MKKYLLFFLVIFLILNGCQKSSTFEKQMDSPTHDLVYRDAHTQAYLNCIDNQNNPYYNVGRQHNELLDSFYNQTYKINDLSLENVILSLEKFGFNYRVIEDSLTREFFRRNISAEEFIMQQNISNTIRLEIGEIFSIISDADDIFEFNNLIYSFNEDVLSSNSYTEDEIAIILSASSIAQYSYCYWSNYFELWEIEQKLHGFTLNTRIPPDVLEDIA